MFQTVRTGAARLILMQTQKDCCIPMKKCLSQNRKMMTGSWLQRKSSFTTTNNSSSMSIIRLFSQSTINIPKRYNAYSISIPGRMLQLRYFSSSYPNKNRNQFEISHYGAIFGMFLIPALGLTAYYSYYGPTDEILEQRLREKYEADIKIAHDKNKGLAELYQHAILGNGDHTKTDIRLQQVLYGGKGDKRRIHATDAEIEASKENDEVITIAEEQEQAKANNIDGSDQVNEEEQPKKKKRRRKRQKPEQDATSSSSPSLISQDDELSNNTSSSQRSSSSNRDRSSRSSSSHRSSRERTKKEPHSVSTGQIVTVTIIGTVAAIATGYLIAIGGGRTNNGGGGGGSSRSRK